MMILGLSMCLLPLNKVYVQLMVTEILYDQSKFDQLRPIKIANMQFI